jgi:3-hydroxyisobutyrate dehydrogenase-like beta-hydroxyacid dehydrogenase
MAAIQTVGLLGLGKMGNPMAKHLLAGGFAVVGFDPSIDARDRARAIGVQVVNAPLEVARVSQLVLIVVGFDSEVEDALFGQDGVVAGAQPGLIVALCSTVAPRYARRLAARLTERHVSMIDTPLARGEAAAMAGKLLIYGAGDEGAFETCRGALSTFASDIFYLGPAGVGQVGKMVNNLILWTCTAANDEALRLGKALGADPERLKEALHHGSGQNWALDNHAGAGGMPWAEKDMNIVLHEADLVRLSLPLAGTVKEVIKGLKIRLGYPMPTAEDDEPASFAKGTQSGRN